MITSPHLQQRPSNIALAMAPWTTERRVFAVEQFFRNDDSIVTVQRLFRRQFNVERQFQIETRYSDGLPHFELPDPS